MALLDGPSFYDSRSQVFAALDSCPEGLDQAEAQKRLERFGPNVIRLIFAGTTVAAGTGKVVVYATGMETEFGKIANLTQSVGAGCLDR